MDRIIKKTGFTLAEVLITLGIIGVVAALMLPFIKDYSDKLSYASKLKKNYSVLSNAALELKSDKGGYISFSSNQSMPTDLMSKLSFQKTYDGWPYGHPKDTNFWYQTPIYYLNNTVMFNDPSDMSTYAGGGILQDGTLVSIMSLGGSTMNCSYNVYGLGNECADILIDVNGANPPNTLGRDIFRLILTRDGLAAPRPSMCSPSGHGCASKIIVEGAMNY